MASEADLTAIVQGLLAGVGGGLSEVKRQKSPEAVAPVIDIKAKLEQIADMKKRLKMAEGQAKMAAEDAARDQREADAKDEAIKGIGERFGPAAGHLARLTGGSQFSSEVVNKMFGVEDAPKGKTAMIQLYDQAKEEGFKGTIIDFMKELTGAKVAPPKPVSVDFGPAEQTRLKEQYDKLVVQKNLRKDMIQKNPKAAMFLPDPGEVPDTFEAYLKQQREILVKQAAPGAASDTTQSGISDEAFFELMERSLQ